MFTEGPLKNCTNPIVMFNQHDKDYVKEFPRAKKGTFDKDGKKVKKAKNATVDAAKKAAGASTEEEEIDESELEDSPAQQVLEVDFICAETMEKIEVKNLKAGMLQLCMMQKKESQRIMFHHEENGQL